MINSVTVLRRSLFSGGSRKIREFKASSSDLDGGGMPWKLGIASVDRDGGLRKAVKPLFGLEGKPGPFPTSLMAASEEPCGCGFGFVSLARASSK